jgi:hypothetical protein
MASARSPDGRKSVRKEMNEKQRLITAASRQKDLVSDDPADVGKRIAGEKKKSTAEINRFWQRKRYKDAYKKARRAGGTLTGAGGKAYESGGLFSRALRRIRRMVGGGGNSHFLMTIAVIGVITLLRRLKGIIDHDTLGKFAVRALDLMQKKFVFHVVSSLFLSDKPKSAICTRGKGTCDVRSEKRTIAADLDCSIAALAG